MNNKSIAIAIGFFLLFMELPKKAKGNTAGNNQDNNTPPPSPDTPGNNMPTFSISNIVNSLPKHATKVYPTRPVSDITTAIIHHSLTNSGSSLAYANYHIGTRNWPGIAYHFVISKDGDIEQTNNLITKSYHASDANGYSIGICLTGNYDQQSVPTVQLQAAAFLMQQLKNELGYIDVDYHRNHSQKSCPGTNFPYGEFESYVDQYATEYA